MVHTERQRPEVGIRMDGETAREEKSRVRCELTAANTKKLYRLMISHEPKEIKRVRKMRYQCDQCGCYLDPGEGRTCDECQRKAEQRHRITERIRLNGQQYEMNMEELLLCRD